MSSLLYAGCKAASSAAMSIFFICIIASRAREAAALSGSLNSRGSTSGTICQETPNLPHQLSPPLARRAPPLLCRCPCKHPSQVQLCPGGPQALSPRKGLTWFVNRTELWKFLWILNTPPGVQSVKPYLEVDRKRRTGAGDRHEGCGSRGERGGRAALLPALLGRGHQVVGLVRSEAGGAWVASQGAEPFVADALEAP